MNGFEYPLPRSFPLDKTCPLSKKEKGRTEISVNVFGHARIEPSHTSLFFLLSVYCLINVY